ncbi:hypothetical protein ACJW30_01G070900 [Castanea mollissima]
MASPLKLSPADQEHLIDKLQVFKIHGRDKRGRKVLCIIGKLFPAQLVSTEFLNQYLEEKIFANLKDKPFSVVYVNTGVQRNENFPGISTLRSIYDAIPINVRDNLEAVYFVHPGLQSRLFLATFGRFIFIGGMYRKLQYVNRVEFLWNHVRRNEIEFEIPEFVFDHDEELEHRPMMEYGLESDHRRAYGTPSVDSAVSMYSMRCIA